MKKKIFQKKQQQFYIPTSKSQAQEFKYILSNQHSKQFHLIDNPDLIFQLAQYKYVLQKNSVQKKENSKARHSARKVYRHKSQDESVFSQFLSQDNKKQEQNNIDFCIKKFSPIQNLQEKSNLSVEEKSTKGNFTIIDLNGLKQRKSVKQQQNKINQNHKKSNNFQKQNAQTRILSATRPASSALFSSSNLTSLSRKGNQFQQKSTWKKALQRKKYCQIKSKLQILLESVQKNENFNFSQVFQYEQLILKDYLSTIVSQLKKQCIQKGQLIETIWNTFFVMINKILSLLTQKNKKNQKNQLTNELILHEEYQSMYEKQINKVKELGKKYNESKNVIDRLIYQLRYKRKQVKKLYKNLATCNDKLNQYKVEHIDLQIEHVDLLVDTKKVTQEEAVEVLKRKIQINKQKYLKQKVGFSKDKIRQKIKKQIEEQKMNEAQQEQIKRQLFVKINSMGKSSKKIRQKTQTNQKSNLIEQLIQKFSNKCIDIKDENGQMNLYKTSRQPQRMSTAINTDDQYKSKGESSNILIQTSFSDKLQFCLINNRGTQTPGAQKIKKSQNVEVQADGDQMRIVLVKAKMMAYKTLDLSFYFDVKKRDQNIKLSHSRRSQFQLKRSSSQKIQQISEISSDQGSSEDKSQVKNKNRISKNLSSAKNQKKISVFNSLTSDKRNSKMKNIRNESLLKQNNRPSVSGKLHKKRISQMGQLLYERQNTKKNRKNTDDKILNRTYFGQESNTLGNSSGFFNKNRSSLCNSNIDSIGDDISISEQKQKYIQKFMMNKQQQYQILDQDAIFKAFKDVVLQRNMKKTTSFSTKSQLFNSYVAEQHKQRDFGSDQDSDLQFLNPKQKLSSCQKIQQLRNQTVQIVRRKQKKVKTLIPTSNLKQIQNNFRKQRQNLRQTFLLNRIIQFTVKKSLIKKKVDSNNFNACKQKSQLSSITQKLDPVMLDLQFILSQNLSQKRHKSQVNIKAANKLIMMTISRSIDKITRNNSILQNLIKPLFQSFEVIYGALKPHDLYRKMLGFISDIISAKQNQNFKQFIFFLGLDREKPYSVYLTTFDVCLFLKLLQKLNLGGKIGSEIQSVFTSKNKVTSQLLNILNSQNIAPIVIRLVVDKVQTLLDKLQDYVRQSEQGDSQSKINLFKVSRMIIEQIIKIRINALDKIQCFTNEQKIKTEINIKDILKLRRSQLNKDKVVEIVNCCRISTTKKLYFAKYIQECCSKEGFAQKDGLEGNKNRNTIKKSQLGIMLIRIGLIQFDDLQERMMFLQQKGKINSKKEQIEDVLKQSQLDYRKVKGYIKNLSQIQTATDQVLNSLLGQIKVIYEISLIKTFDSKNKN